MWRFLALLLLVPVFVGAWEDGDGGVEKKIAWEFAL